MANKNLGITFSTQKGGAGKTTLTVLTASYLHYIKGFNVAIIDCDYPQYSIIEMRGRDLKLVTESDYYKSLAYEQFSRLNKKMFPIVKSTPEEASTILRSLKEQNRYDFIIVDFPGTVNKEGIISTLSRMDYIFSPITADRVVLESTLRFATRINASLIKSNKSNIKGMYLFWNMVDGREKTELYELYEKVIKDLNLSLLTTFLPDSKRFRREQSITRRPVFRSTIFPPERSVIKGSNVDLLVDEILQIIDQ